MFGHKAPMPCDNWLGCGHYDMGGLKTAWLSQQLDALVSANKQALKLIRKTTQCSKVWTGGKELLIPVGNHVLLGDHPEGWNKVQDKYKSDVYVIVGHHHNIHYVQLLNKDRKSKPKIVNCHQIYDLNCFTPPSEPQDSESRDGDNLTISCFLAGKSSGSNNTFLLIRFNLIILDYSPTNKMHCNPTCQ